MIAALGRWWRRRQRKVDVDVLWPACKAGTTNLQDARGAFYIHCMMDSAWLLDYTEDQIIKQIETMH